MFLVAVVEIKLVSKLGKEESLSHTIMRSTTQ